MANELNIKSAEEISKEVKPKIVKYKSAEKRCHNCSVLLNENEEMLCKACQSKEREIVDEKIKYKEVFKMEETEQVVEEKAEEVKEEEKEEPVEEPKEE